MTREELTRLYQVYLGLVVFLYGTYGLNFLIFANRSTVVQIGGPLASPLFWGWSFVICAVIISQSILRPDLPGLAQLAVTGMIALGMAYLAVRTIIVIQTGLDFTATTVWIFFVAVHFLAHYMNSRINPAQVPIIPADLQRGWRQFTQTISRSRHVDESHDDADHLST